MKRIEQLTKELQALVGNAELDEIISQKMSDAYFDGENEAIRRNTERWDAFGKIQRERLTKEEKDRMIKTHHFDTDPEWSDADKCVWCELEYDDFQKCPQYCEHVRAST